MRRAVSEVGAAGEVDVEVVCDAMCLRPFGRIEPFAGAPELLAAVATAGLRVVIASNVLWCGGGAYRRDLDDIGLGDHVDAFVSSLDVAWRKPEPAFFEAAVAAAGCPAGACVMVGNSEVNDIGPAHRLGMATIRVAIGVPVPDDSAADHVCGTLAAVGDVLRAPRSAQAVSSPTNLSQPPASG